MTGYNGWAFPYWFRVVFVAGSALFWGTALALMLLSQ